MSFFLLGREPVFNHFVGLFDFFDGYYICLLCQQMRYSVNNKYDLSYSRQKKTREQSGVKSKLRTSVQNMKHLRLELTKLRTTLSTASINYFKRPPSVQALNVIPPLVLDRRRSRIDSSPNKLMSKFGYLEEKLNRAKGYMRSSEKLVPQIKSVPKLQLKEQLATCHESIVESDVKKQKPSLRHYTSMRNKPAGIKLSRTYNGGRGHKYYVNEVVRAINEKSSLAMQHINHSIQNLLQYKLIKMNYEGKWDDQKIIIPRTSPHKKTLFIDLDETIIHCNQANSTEADIKVTINLNGAEYKVGFNIRPYTITFLKKMKKKWELIVFTASHHVYADTVLDEIDPDKQLFDYRLYRDHCRQLTTQFFVKDLSRFDRDLSQSVLVDNCAYSFAMQIDNGVPVLPYYEGKDFQLTSLQSYLSKLVEQQDVRVMNRRYFQMFQYTSFDNSCDLVRQLYCNQKDF